MHPAPALRRLLALLVLCAAPLAAAAGASAQPQQKQPQRRRPVTLAASALFGSDLLIPNTFATVVVEARNNTRRTLRGTLSLSIQHWQNRPDRHTLRMDLPASAERRAVVELYVPDGATVEVRFLEDGDVLERAVISPTYTSAASGVVLLSNPPRLRGALLDMDVNQPAVGPYGSPSVVRIPIGVVPFDPATGDPILPDDGVGWAAVSLLVAGAPELSRVGADEQAAVVDWIRAGGQLLVFPRTDADLRDPFLRSLVGEVEIFEGAETSANRQLVPEGARGRYLRGGPGIRTESFGGSKALGFGRVHLAIYDGNLPSQVDTLTESRTLIRSILEAPRVHGVDEPMMPMGRGQDDMSTDPYGGGPAFGTLRAALDPNEGYRPALGLVAIVLLLYVILVGPVNFAFVGRRNRPALALLTTPVAAFGCMVIMLGVGYLGKGTRMRYRAVEVVELREGDPVGPTRRYSGLFLTRPATFELPSPDRGIARVVRAPTADLSPVTDHGTERPTLRGLRGRLWETVFIREEYLADMGGPITFEEAGRRLMAVHNGTGATLRGAVIVDAASNVYRVGDIPAGGRAVIPQVSTLLLSNSGYWGGDIDPSTRSLAREMGLPQEHETALDGTLRALGGTLATPPVPTLFAWVEHEPRPRVADNFAPELDLRFLRVVPDLGGPGVTPMPEDAGDLPVPEILDGAEDLQIPEIFQ